MGAFNTFFNYRTSHHAKAMNRRQKNARANAQLTALVNRRRIRKAADEADQYRALGANITPVKVDPGWYPDHDQRGMLRYWDGQRWTDLTSAPKPHWV